MRPPVTAEQLVEAVEGFALATTPLDRLRAAVAMADDLSGLADGLVGHFVDAARANGCSWAQIGSELGVSKQAAQQRFVGRPPAGIAARLRPFTFPGRPPRRHGFFSRFTPAACDAIAAAQGEARSLGHGTVGTEHLLLSLMDDPEGAPATALATLGIGRDDVRTRIAGAAGPQGAPLAEPAPFAPEAKKALELALRESLQADAREVTPAHVLRGIVREGRSRGAQVLAELGADADTVRRALDDAG